MSASRKSGSSKKVASEPIEEVVPVTTTKTKKTKSAPAARVFNNINDFKHFKRDSESIPVENVNWDWVVMSAPKKGDRGGSVGYDIYYNYLYDGPTGNRIGKMYVTFINESDVKNNKLMVCYGIQANNIDKDGKPMIVKETGLPMKLSGYRAPIVVTSQTPENPNVSDSEQARIDFLNKLNSFTMEWLIQNKSAYGKTSLADEKIPGLMSELLFYSKNKEQEIIENKSPTLYTNLNWFAKNREKQDIPCMETTFYGPGDVSVNPLDPKYKSVFFIDPVLCIDRISIGAKISIKHYIHDATVFPLDRMPKKRLARVNTNAAESTDTDPSSSSKTALYEDDDDDGEDDQ
jgi:hypothetical protein